jgi:hypothetical protein
MPSLSMLRDEPTELQRNPVLDPLSRASPHARLHGGGAARGCGGVPRPSPRQRTTSSFLCSAKARVYENGAKESTGRVYPVAYTPMPPPTTVIRYSRGTQLARHARRKWRLGCCGELRESRRKNGAVLLRGGDGDDKMVPPVGESAK